MQQAARDVHQAKAPPPKEMVPDIPIENAAHLPAAVARLRALLARLTDERDQLKKKVMHLTVALAVARNASAEEGMIDGGLPPSNHAAASSRRIMPVDRSICSHSEEDLPAKSSRR